MLTPIAVSFAYVLIPICFVLSFWMVLRGNGLIAVMSFAVGCFITWITFMGLVPPELPEW